MFFGAFNGYVPDITEKTGHSWAVFYRGEDVKMRVSVALEFKNPEIFDAREFLSEAYKEFIKIGLKCQPIRRSAG